MMSSCRMQETILEGKVKGQEIAYGYTKEVNDSAKPRTGKKRKASVCAAAVASGSNVRLESRVFSILICAS